MSKNDSAVTNASQIPTMSLADAQKALRGSEPFTVVASTVNVEWCSPSPPKIDQQSCMRTNMKDTTRVTEAFNAISSVQLTCFEDFVRHPSRTAQIYNRIEAGGSKWGVVTWADSKVLLEDGFGQR